MQCSSPAVKVWTGFYLKRLLGVGGKGSDVGQCIKLPMENGLPPSRGKSAACACYKQAASLPPIRIRLPLARFRKSRAIFHEINPIRIAADLQLSPSYPLSRKRRQPHLCVSAPKAEAMLPARLARLEMLL